ncbi:RING finger protein 150a isoform X2 [Girardinichthys multiradiatus]|uniref:RING finger protein 150a isoform X2 n=1 Tax=Girardinichthys multiradiatus TaxID=208333 RepID=UPI001FAD85C3|nr:RING finger protein 150a isoform X2 [Girardinichthys multiradiatus]
MAPSLLRVCRSLAQWTWLLSFCFVQLLCLDFSAAEKEEWYTAFVNITYLDPVTSEVRTEKTECGRYGEHSPKKEARGRVLVPGLPQDRQGCDPNVRFPPVPQNTAWVALVAAGNCTFREKIHNAANSNASAVVIYNSANDTITMPHSDTGDIVAIMIPEPKGREIVTLLERRFVVVMHITVGTRNLQKYRRLGDAAKKAISKLQVRTLKKGDMETEPDFDNCAVCIECYKPNDVVRILPCRHVFHKHCVDPWLQDHRTCPMCKINILKALGIPFSADCTNETPLDYETSIGGPLTNPISAASDITVNESSVALDPAGRVIDLHQLHHYQETASQAGQSHPIASCENQPPMSSDSDTSAIMSVDASMSEADFPLEQEHDDAKSRGNPC